MRGMLSALVLLCISGPTFARDARELWLYYPNNFQVPENLEKLEKDWRRAKGAGYTHVLVADSKFAKLGDVPDVYFKNVARTKQVAQDLGLKLVPGVFPVGYSNDLLWHDPNLAEGLPVHGSLFVVGPGGEARLEADPPVTLGKYAWKDDSVRMDGPVATTGEGGSGPNARWMYKLGVKPFRCYHVSAWVKTQDFSGQPEIKALAGDRSLNYKALGVKPTQDWAEHHVVFNSLNHDQVNLYFGVWGETKGTLQWKDWKIEEVGLLNVLRRPGTPVGVTDDRGGRLYEEGKDYERIEDPKTGTVPWPGEYEVWHEPPAIKTTLPPGTRLRVSWYHPAVIHDEQVVACLSEPKLNELLADQARRMKQAWGDAAAGYMMSHDEIRTMNWCKACQERKATPARMLADNVRYCRELLRPSPAYVWGDMFDPFHNAVKGPYYLVNGPWTGSWEGLDKDVVIMNWNFDKRDQSLAFFADRGHRQIIAGYYDDQSLRSTREWLKTARDEKSVIGYMYTTWQRDYSQMESFAKLCKEAEKGK